MLLLWKLLTSLLVNTLHSRRQRLIYLINHPLGMGQFNCPLSGYRAADASFIS